MKKLLTLFLAMLLVLSLAACGGGAPTVVEPSETPAVTDQPETENEATAQPDKNAAEEPEKTEKPISTPTQKPSEKPQTQKPSAEPTKQPETKPSQTPTPAPTQTPAPSTLGTTLLADFKAKAASGMSVQAIAEGLLSNPAILFSGGAMPVEEGLLSGFDNAEIKGFTSGVTFMPMIGSIPFVGYVFELSNAADVPAFIKTLEQNANRRWNICVEADEMVTGSHGNKVFFVMCPKSLEE